MNDTKVQRYAAGGVMPLDDNGRWIPYAQYEALIADHARIVAEKDASFAALDGDYKELREAYNKEFKLNGELMMKIDAQDALLAKYQRLHAADVAFDSGYSDVDVRVKRIKERRLAMEDISNG